MSLEEFEDELTPRQKKYVMMQSVKDWGFGIVYIGIAMLILFSEKLNFRTQFTESPWGKVFAGLMILYGVFRIYRGIKKDYYVERDKT